MRWGRHTAVAVGLLMGLAAGYFLIRGAIGISALEGCACAVMLAAVRVLPPASDELVARAVNHYDQLDDKTLAAWEQRVRHRDGGDPQAKLLFALRVSKILPKVSKPTTLARWWQTIQGPDGLGGCGGKAVVNLASVQALLDQRYLQCFELLLNALGEQAQRLASKAPTPQLQAASLEHATERVQRALQGLDDPALPGAAQAVDRVITLLRREAQSLCPVTV